MEALDLLSLGKAPENAAAVALTDGRVITYRELRSMASRCREILGMPRKSLVVVDEPRSLPGLLGYLATLSAGHAVLLAEGGDLALWSGLITDYQPELLVTTAAGSLGTVLERAGYRRRAATPLPVWSQSGELPASGVHRELGMLVRTSGSLGVPKAVRLSYANLRANATAIAEALKLRGGDRALTSLPLDFCYGLSVVNSAFAAGASIAISTWSPSSELFWQYSGRVGGTCVGTVPATCRFLRACGWEPSASPHLRLLLQAGGPLDSETITYYATRMASQGGEFVSMYGQTEATARIACLPGELAITHCGSVGTAVPGSSISIAADSGAEAGEGEIGEVTVHGPGVMMGYAEGRPDLATGDQQGALLRTGDLGYLRDGLLYITGRKDRQVKVFGHRINLDELETALSLRGVPAAVGMAADDHIVVVAEDSAHAVGACRELARRIGLPSSAVSLVAVPCLPRTRTGKVDRLAAARVAENGVQ
jgi:long-chain acyl-CoA synthetase